MVFSSFTRTESGTQIIFKSSAPIEYVKTLKYYKDDSSGVFSKKEFRWSFNQNYWANWEDLSQTNIAEVNINRNRYVYFEIRYTASNPSAKVTKFSLNYTELTAADEPCVKNVVPPTPADTSPTVIPPASCPTPRVTEITNADTLGGKTPDYYLWRPNHKGQQSISTITDLQSVLNNLAGAIQDVDISGAENVSGGGIGVYYNTENKVIYFKTLIGGENVLISENSQGHIRIDMDDPSVNELYELIGNFDGVNIGGGEGEVFSQRSGEDFEFRTIAAGNANVNVVTSGDQIIISLDASASGESIWADPDPVSATVGGISSGDTFDGSTAINILNKMLYEYFPPNVNLALTPSSGYYEKYSSVGTATIYGNFNNNNFVKATVTDVSSYVSVDGGSLQPTNSGPTHISYPDVSSGTFSFFDGSYPNYEDVVYHIKTYNNVNGITMPTLDSSISLTFVEPYIYGLVDDTINVGNITPTIIQNLHTAGQKLIVPKQSNSINYDVSANYVKIKFVYAYPENYGGLNSIFDVKNDFNVTTSFDSTTLNITIGASPSVPYKVYIKNHWISFTPDVSVFKLDFNI